MRKRIVIMVCVMLLFMTACSSEEKLGNEASDQNTVSVEKHNTKAQEEAEFNKGEGDQTSTEPAGDTPSEQSSIPEKQTNEDDRKIIYTANLEIEIKNYESALQDIQNNVEKHQGYIVESSMYEEVEDRGTSGFITVRIPQQEFRGFIQLVEDGSKEVLSSSISGQDVTEEYVDLEARLNSKQVVEKRLLSFMEEAKKTEDLLAVSKDLATVQEEIEQIKGRMKYLENKSDLATITIQMTENNLTVSGEDLNTWEKTKQQFLRSLHWLRAAFSGFVIFFAGNLPLLIVVAVIGVIVWRSIRKHRDKR